MNKNEGKNMSECDGCEPPFSDSCVDCSELSKNTKLSQYDKQELRSREIKRYFEVLNLMGKGVLKL